MNNQLLDFEIRDLNIHNVLATLAVLSFLKVDITDLGEKFKKLRVINWSRQKILYF